MLRVKDNVVLEKTDKLKYDDFNEQYDYEYGNQIIISIDEYSRTLTTYFYDIGEMIELDYERDATIEDLKEYAPFLLDFIERVDE